MGLKRDHLDPCPATLTRDGSVGRALIDDSDFMLFPASLQLGTYSLWGARRRGWSS